MRLSISAVVNNHPICYFDAIPSPPAESMQSIVWAE